MQLVDIEYMNEGVDSMKAGYIEYTYGTVLDVSSQADHPGRPQQRMAINNAVGRSGVDHNDVVQYKTDCPHHGTHFISIQIPMNAFERY